MSKGAKNTFISTIVSAEQSLFRSLHRNHIRLGPGPIDHSRSSGRDGLGDEVPLPHVKHDKIKEEVGIMLDIPGVVDGLEHLVA